MISLSQETKAKVWGQGEGDKTETYKRRNNWKKRG